MLWFWWVLLGVGVVLVGGLLLAMWLGCHTVASVAPPHTGHCDEHVEGGFERCPEPAAEHLGGRDRCTRHAEFYRYE